METKTKILKPRLTSLDALRGFNLFFLVALGPVLLNFCNGVPNGCFDWLFDPLSHLLTTSNKSPRN